MEPVSILVGYIANQLSKSKFTSNAKDELFEASWRWIRPLFLKDDSALEDLKASPNDKLNLQDVELTVAKHLRKNPSELPKLESLVTKIMDENTGNVRIVNQQHSGSGDNIAGDKITGDKYE